MSLFPFNHYSIRNTPYILNYIYIGQVYSMFHEYTNVANGATVSLQITTGSRIAHVFSQTIKSSGGGDLLVSMYEGQTLTTGTTPPTMPPKSFDRRIGATNAATTAFFTNPTNINIGAATLINRERIYNTGGNQGGGASSIANLEMVLQANTTYLLQFSNTGNTLNIAFQMQFYESGN